MEQELFAGLNTRTGDYLIEHDQDPRVAKYVASNPQHAEDVHVLNVTSYGVMYSDGSATSFLRKGNGGTPVPATVQGQEAEYDLHAPTGPQHIAYVRYALWCQRS